MNSVKWTMVCGAMGALAIVVFAALTFLGYSYFDAVAPGIIIVLLSGIPFKKAQDCAQREKIDSAAG